MWRTPLPSIWSNGVQCKHPDCRSPGPVSLSHLYPTSDRWGGPGASSTTTPTDGVTVYLRSPSCFWLSSHSAGIVQHLVQCDQSWERDCCQIALWLNWECVKSGWSKRIKMTNIVAADFQQIDLFWWWRKKNKPTCKINQVRIISLT